MSTPPHETVIQIVHEAGAEEDVLRTIQYCLESLSQVRDWEVIGTFNPSAAVDRYGNPLFGEET